MENYLFDPVLVYACLVGLRCAPAVDGCARLLPGDEHTMRSADPNVLQRMIDVVSHLFEKECAELSCSAAPQCADLVTGQTIKLPAWVLEQRGHDLEPTAIAVGERLGIGTQLNRRNLRLALTRSRLVYKELADQLANIQTGS